MNAINKIILVLIIITSTSCLEEDTVTPFSIKLDDSAKFVKFVEDNGDFPNSEEAPGLISADQLFSSLSNYWIIDIRDSLVFFQGHIESAINVLPVHLKHVVDSLNPIIPLRRVIIVSKNGQSASYFASVLRISGCKNVFTLNYGMASWNPIFANEWLQALGTTVGIDNYNNEDYLKNPLSNLPKINFPVELITIQEKIDFSINDLLKNGFNESIEFVNDLSYNTRNNKYVVCYGQGRLYYAPRFIPPLQELGHPIDATWYVSTPLFDFRSTRFLQTLPNNKAIILYSGDGQLSASMVAYLRFLGYDAKTLMFGANQLFYPRLEADPELAAELFSQSDIMNYPFVSGR